MTSEPLQLRPPRHQVSARAVTWWRWRGVAWTVSGLVVVGLASLLPIVSVAAAVVAAVVVAVAGGVLTTIAPSRRYRWHRWEATDLAVYASRGWWWQESRVAPLSRVQTVDSKRGPLQRALGLASITVTTASAVGPVTIVGLDHQVAADLVEHLTARTEATPGDAT